MAEKLRLIPELEGIPVFVYDEKFTGATDVGTGIWKLQPPSLLIVWRGTMPGSKSRLEVWRHNFSVAVRSHDDMQSAFGIFQIWWAISNGIPSDGAGCTFRCCSIHESVYAMDTPSIARQTLYITPEIRLDYHEVTISLTEKGDY